MARRALLALLAAALLVAPTARADASIADPANDTQIRRPGGAPLPALAACQDPRADIRAVDVFVSDQLVQFRLTLGGASPAPTCGNGRLIPLDATQQLLISSENIGILLTRSDSGNRGCALAGTSAPLQCGIAWTQTQILWSIFADNDGSNGFAEVHLHGQTVAIEARTTSTSGPCASCDVLTFTDLGSGVASI